MIAAPSPLVTTPPEVIVTLADPDRPSLPGIEPAVLRAGVARYAGRTIVTASIALPAFELVSPVRGAVRRIAIVPHPALPGVTELLEIAPMPFAIEAVARHLRGLPTFYLGPFTAAPADNVLVGAGAVIASGVTAATIAAVFPDGHQLETPTWMKLLEDALIPAGEIADAAGWSALRFALYGETARCRVLDHAGQRLADDLDPLVSKAFTVALRDPSDPPGAPPRAERTVTLGADSDLEAALRGGPAPSSLAPPAGQIVEVRWAGAPPAGAPPIPMIALYRSRASAAPEAALAIDAGPVPPTLQVLDLARWFAQPAPGTAPAQYRTGNRVEPLVDGIVSFQRLAADLRLARSAGNGAHLAAWTLNEFALDPATDDDDIVDLLREIHANGGVVRVLATKFLILKDPDVESTRLVAMIFILLLCESAFLVAAAEAALGHPDSDNRAILAFFLAPALVFALGALVANADGFQWLAEKVLETAKGTVDAINAIDATAAAPLAAYSSNRMALTHNPLADGLVEPLFGLEADVESFSVFHNKCQMVKRPATADDDGYVAYLGGIDVNRNRLDSPAHGVRGAYHDVHCRLTGPITHDVFVSFEERWRYDEQVRGGTAAELIALPPDPATPAPTTLQPSLHVARVGRTYFGPSPVVAIDPPLTYAPSGDAGIFHTLMLAMAAARDCIYIEDQYFTPPDTFVEVLRQARLRCHRLIILLPGETDQPFGDSRRRVMLDRLRGTDPSNGWQDRMLVGYPQRRPILQAPGRVAARGRCWLARACGASDDAILVATPARVLAAPFWLWIDGELMLAHDVTAVEEAGAPAARVRVVRGSAPGDPRWGANPRAHGKDTAVTMSSVKGVYVHAKTMMIDDTFVSIGSANLNRRGFFTDGEINVFAIPQQLRAAPDNPARALRTALWAEHLGLPPAMGPVLLEDAVAGFELFRRNHQLGNRFTPLHATNPRSQISITDEGILPFSIAGMLGTLLGNLPFTAQAIYQRLWNLAVDAPSHTDPDPQPGPV